MFLQLLAALALNVLLVPATAAPAKASLAPRAHVMETHLRPPAAYEAFADEHGLGLRLVVKFKDGLAIRAAHMGVSTHLEASRPHVLAINRTLAAHGAALRPVLAGVGPEWEELVERAERLSGRAQPDLRAMCQVDLGSSSSPSAAELVAVGETLALLPSVEFAEIEYTGMPPPGHQHHAHAGTAKRDCPVPPPDHVFRNGSSALATPDFTSLQGYYRGPDEGGFDAEWAAEQGADGSNVRYSDCEYCWIWDHEDVIQIKEEGHPCDPGARGKRLFRVVVFFLLREMFICQDRLGTNTGNSLKTRSAFRFCADMFADHGTASVGVTSGIDNGFGILGIAPSTTPFTYSEWTDQGGRRERAIAQAVAVRKRAAFFAPFCCKNGHFTKTRRDKHRKSRETRGDFLRTLARVTSCCWRCRQGQAAPQRR